MNPGIQQPPAYIQEIEPSRLELINHRHQITPRPGADSVAAVTYLMQSRAYRASSKIHDISSKDILVPHHTYLNTYAKFFDGMAAEATPSTTLIHPNSFTQELRTIGRSVMRQSRTDEDSLASAIMAFQMKKNSGMYCPEPFPTKHLMD